MQVRGILETALSVADIQRSAEFYEKLFGFKRLLEVDRLIALDVAGQNVLLLFPRGVTDEAVTMPGGVIPGHGASGRSHFAFSIAAEDFDAWTERLQSEGIAVESTMTWDGGARSMYFRDPDQHLVELITPGFWSIY